MPEKRCATPSQFKTKKQQAAIEYLMTHMWAIVMIAIVLAVLFEFGLFSGTLTPRSAPGSCQVIRPYGVATTIAITLQGTCSGQEPQFAATFSGSGSYMQASNNININSNTMAVTAWIKVANTVSTSFECIICSKDGASGGFGFGITGTSLTYYINGASTKYVSVSGATGIIAKNIWYYVAATYNGQVETVYINANQVGTFSPVTMAINSPTTNVYTSIGADGASQPTNAFFVGSISNLQVYNSSISAGALLSQYREGIGAPPVNLDSLVGWWPLNGDSMDYSGNGYSMITYGGITYPYTWTTGYTAP